MTEQTARFEEREKQLQEAADRLQIPKADFTEAVSYLSQFIQDNPLDDDNKVNYWLLMGIAAYSAGKEAAKT